MQRFKKNIRRSLIYYNARGAGMTFFGAGIVFVFVFCADDSLATTFGSTFGAGITLLYQ